MRSTPAEPACEHHRMHARRAGLLAVLLVARTAAARGTCAPDGADAADVVAARAAIAVECACGTAVSHEVYVRCAARTARVALSSRRCLKALVRCAARSTCGTPGAVVCCRSRDGQGSVGRIV